jgi:hypothetical protein
MLRRSEAAATAIFFCMPPDNSLCAILPTSWIAGLVTFILASPAANEAIATSEIATAPIVLGFRIVRVPIEIALNRQN